jgi:hypothetical protein
MIGDQQDISARLKALLPNGWFRDETPILDAVLSGIAWALSFAYGLIAYARLQTRIDTATDGFLDLISYDFFGDSLPRKSGESDAAFRSRIQAALFPEKGTRQAMIRMLELLTGRTPIIFEPSRPADTGAYNTNTMGYGVAGAYGSLMLPAQAFITAYRPTGQGVPGVAGYGNPQGAYNTGSRIEYASAELIAGAVKDSDIYAAISNTAPAGTLMWTRIKS